MPQYTVLFRLPLRPGSRMSQSLAEAGWHSLSDAIFFRNVEMDYGDVVNYIKTVCQTLPNFVPNRGPGAFSIIPRSTQPVMKHSA